MESVKTYLMLARLLKSKYYLMRAKKSFEIETRLSLSEIKRQYYGIKLAA